MGVRAFSHGRRRALGVLAGAGAAIALPATAEDGSPGAAMALRQIPSSGEALPVIGLGTYRSFDVPAEPPPQADLRAVLRLFVEGGGRLVDSSPMYGRSEDTLGALASALAVGGRLFHATKVWTRGRAEGIAQMNRSFERMGVTRMDLMQVHNLLDVDTHLVTLREWKAAGRLRYLGVTHYHAGAYVELARVLERARPDFVQLNYSLAEREAEARLLPLAQSLGIAVIVNRPFAQGALFGRVKGRPLPAWAAEFGAASWAQLFLRYILAHPAVSCVIPATGNPRHLADNLGAGLGALPGPTQGRRLRALFDAL